MHCTRSEIRLAAKTRGIHLVTAEVLAAIPELREYDVGLLHLFILHTSASLAVNENADPDVRHDVEAHLDRIAPENASYYRHTSEGPDDMPAHIKALTLGSGLLLPIAGGRLALGTWQGIYLGEHRDHGGARRIAVTIMGERSR